MPRIDLMKSSGTRCIQLIFVVLLHRSPLLVPTYAWSPSSTGSQFTRCTTRMFRKGASDNREEKPFSFSTRPPPYLALITPLDACDSPQHVQRTVQAVQQAGSVDLVSVRVPVEAPRDQVVELLRQLVSLPSLNWVVVTSDWADVAVQCGAHGVHVKEAHRDRIPAIRQAFAPTRPVIGTSAHSVDSAIEAQQLYQPDYFFVGTCYPTASHPEKDANQLEGPELPGQVAQALSSSTIVLAIGGIEPDNCHEPVALGAHGVATIRSVLEASDPGQVVNDLYRQMEQAWKKRELSGSPPQD